MKITGVIFDLDGTLLDSMFIWDTIGANYLLSRGITPENDLNEKFKAMSIVQAAQYYQRNYGLSDSVEEIVDGVNAMIDHLYSDTVQLKPGVVDFLKKLKADGVKMCVATATDRYMAEAALKRNQIFDFFCGILTCTEVGFGKDTPEIYEKALQLLGTQKNETLIFEDAIHAIETAKKAHFTVVGIFDKSFTTEQPRIKELSDYYLHSFETWRKLYD